jgi:hypothetical protein
MKHVGRRSLRHAMIDLLTFIGARHNPAGRHVAAPSYGYGNVIALSTAGEAGPLELAADDRVAA